MTERRWWACAAGIWAFAIVAWAIVLRKVRPYAKTL